MCYNFRPQSLVKSYSLKEGNVRLSPSFMLREFASKDGADRVLVHPDLVLLVQAIRDHFGPVAINSGYRTPSHNKSIGGAPQSLHTKGMAADLQVRGAHPQLVAAVARNLGAGGVKAYDTFCHVDVGPTRSW
jgi:zinc D-Ala-D-Ala carboxypeptidase